jgi:hypothetical protein
MEFLEAFKHKVAILCKCSYDQVAILGIKKGSSIFDFITNY